MTVFYLHEAISFLQKDRLKETFLTFDKCDICENFQKVQNFLLSSEFSEKSKVLSQNAIRSKS